MKLFSIEQLDLVTDFPFERRKRFGEPFINCIKQYSEQHGLSTNVSKTAGVCLVKSYFGIILDP